MVQGKYQIRWTAKAFSVYERTYKELLYNWSFTVAEKFRLNVEFKLYSLSFQPFIGRRVETRPNMRSILVSKYSRLYYRVNKDTIELISIFDMRQNPSKNRFK